MNAEEDFSCHIYCDTFCSLQASCIPLITSGNDVVIAAETGSGKTHGYLVPLIDKLCASYDIAAAAADLGAISLPRKFSLVLCPNVMLCQQVANMANCLQNMDGEPLLRASAVCGNQVSLLLAEQSPASKVIFLHKISYIPGCIPPPPQKKKKKNCEKGFKG